MDGRSAAKLLPLKTTQTPLRCAFVDHLRGALRHGTIISFPSDKAQVCTLSGALAKQPKLRGQPADVLVGPVLVDDGDPPEPVNIPEIYVGKQFVRVIHTAPKSAWKTVPLSAVVGGRLEPHHLAVVRLDCVGATDAGPMLTTTGDTCIGLFDGLAAGELGEAAAHGVDDADVLMWPTPDRSCIKHCFALQQLVGFDCAVISDVLEQLLARQALPGHRNSWKTQRDHIALPTLQQLELHNLVGSTAVEGGVEWRLSHTGLQSLSTAWHANSPPVSLTSARADAPLQNRSSYELLRELHTADWTWKRLPSDALKQADIEPYCVGRSKLYRSVGERISSFYLSCLVAAPRLEADHGNDGVPHGQTEAVYVALLRGQKWSDLKVDVVQLILRKRARRRVGGAAPLWPAIAFDGDDDVAAPAAPAAGLDRQLVVDAELGDGSDGGGRSSQEGSRDGNDTSPHSDDGEDSDDPGDQPPGPPPLPPPLLPPASEEVNLQPLPIQAPPPLRSGIPDDMAYHVEEMNALAGTRWGAFVFSIKRPHTKFGGPFGGLQASCPFHKKNARTPACKRYIHCRGCSPEDRHEMMLQLRFWCSQALSVNRQWEHVFTCVLEPHPPEDVIESRRITEGPTEAVVDDDTFYRLEARPALGRGRRGGRGRSGRGAAGSSAASVGAARGRGRGEGGGRGRSGGRGRDRAAATAPGSGASSSSSSPGSSGYTEDDYVSIGEDS
jgi:hypothetical protein